MASLKKEVNRFRRMVQRSDFMYGKTPLIHYVINAKSHFDGWPAFYRKALIKSLLNKSLEREYMIKKGFFDEYEDCCTFPVVRRPHTGSRTVIENGVAMSQCVYFDELPF